MPAMVRAVSDVPAYPPLTCTVGCFKNSKSHSLCLSCVGLHVFMCGAGLCAGAASKPRDRVAVSAEDVASPAAADGAGAHSSSIRLCAVSLFDKNTCYPVLLTGC